MASAARHYHIGVTSEEGSQGEAAFELLLSASWKQSGSCQKMMIVLGQFYPHFALGMEQRVVDFLPRPP